MDIAMGFAEYKNLDLVEVNASVLEKWKKENCFERTLKLREAGPKFIFFEGPPSANGMPGIHHVMARSIKDAVCRYKTQSGYLVNRKAGWDTHGLPVELGVEKMLGITKEDIGRKISVDDYNAACRKEVMKYTAEWVNLTQRIGYWVDMDNPYITYDNRYIETLWYLLKKLYDKGLLYKGYTIQPYSPAAGTGLSSHELNQPGCYRDVKDTTCVGQFRMLDPKPEMTGWGTPYFIAWTTTPWTLPSNVALCVGPKIDYVAVRTYNAYTGEKITVVLGKPLLYAHFNKKAEGIALEDYKAGDKLVPFQVVGEYKGSDLVGMKYEQLIPWVKPVELADASCSNAVDCPSGIRIADASQKAFRIIPGDYVTTEDGTGIVHIAPTFGADDAFVAKAAGIPSLFMINRKGETRPMVDLTGKFYRTEELDSEFVKNFVNLDLYREYEGAWVKNAYDPQYTVNGKYDEKAASAAPNLDVALCLMMKGQSKVFKIEKHVHNYPHCWRTDKPVLYYPLDSWFIRASAAKERMYELNRTIDWKPESTGTGRFGKWLENLNDWNLSRSRYWGTPLPIWRDEDGAEKCIGSVEELYAEIEKSIAAGFMKENPYRTKGFVPGVYTKENYEKIDLHRPYVDDIILVSEAGKPMKRELDLIDVWFDSGSMPYAQLHYPFENKELVDEGRNFPADFIAEGVDQTRGWFYTLHAIATMAFDSVAYRSVISNGLVLDKNGMKMSKRLGNAVDPFQALDTYGADALRWYMLTNAQPWDNLKFDTAGVDEIKRKFFGTLYNTYSFFALYANVDGFDAKAAEVPVSERPELDRWVISYLNSLIKNVRECYENFDITGAGRLIQDFVCDNLSNWYVRLGRKRFWGTAMSSDKLSAYQTLYSCLETVAMLAAPIAPFYMDRLFIDLNAVSGKHSEASVHHTIMPVANESLIDPDLEEQMALAQNATSMVLSLRRKVNINVRKPLAKMIVPVLDSRIGEQLSKVRNLILNEVNVKEMEFISDTTGLITKKIKPNFKTLGKKYGAAMKSIASAFASFTQQQIAQIEKDGNYSFQLDNPAMQVELVPEDYQISSEDMPGWLVTSMGQLTIALDITITEALRQEGLARELVNRIQNARKECKLEVTDRIKVELKASGENSRNIESALASFGDYVRSQTLTAEISFNENISVPEETVICAAGGICKAEWEDGDQLVIKIDKI